MIKYNYINHFIRYKALDINFSYGYYNEQGELFQVSADLNVSKNYYKKLKEILKIKKTKYYPLVRVGQNGCDGDYIMLGNFDGDSKIVYSFGINDDVNWDNTLANIGYNIFMYDHTIENLPFNRDEFHFFKEGISGIDEENHPLKTLKYYIEQNGHKNTKNMILKMDVEGAEWDFLETVDSKTLRQFNQIIIEYHNILKAGLGDKILKLLAKLNKTHQLIHLHGNNSGYIIRIGDKVFPDVIEATYVIKDRYTFEEDPEHFLPIDIDVPSDSCRPDVILGKWNYPMV